jgi:hypothetical protein
MIRGMIYQDKLFVFENCVNGIREFKRYQFDRKKPELPEDRSNHVMDALGMSIENSWNTLQYRAKPFENEEVMTPYWQRKFAAGIYKGNGKLEDKSSSRLSLEEEFGGSCDDNFDY